MWESLPYLCGCFPLDIKKKHLIHPHQSLTKGSKRVNLLERLFISQRNNHTLHLYSTLHVRKSKKGEEEQIPKILTEETRDILMGFGEMPSGDRK